MIDDDQVIGGRRMKSLLTTPLVILALLAPLNAGADFDKGVAAYYAGDYATALQEFKKAAQQGAVPSKP